MVKQQRRSRKIAMTKAEVDAFLGTERTCRVATISPHGPHNTPLWFGWDGAALWLYSIVRSQRWVDITRDPRVAVIVDAGADYFELRGVEITGRAEVVGDAPRIASGAETADDAILGPVEQLFADKYTGGTFAHDGRHAWLRVTPRKLTSWDFRKISR